MICWRGKRTRICISCNVKPLDNRQCICIQGHENMLWLCYSASLEMVMLCWHFGKATKRSAFWACAQQMQISTYKKVTHSFGSPKTNSACMARYTHPLHSPDILSSAALIALWSKSIIASHTKWYIFSNVWMESCYYNTASNGGKDKCLLKKKAAFTQNINVMTMLW